MVPSRTLHHGFLILRNHSNLLRHLLFKYRDKSTWRYEPIVFVISTGDTIFKVNKKDCWATHWLVSVRALAILTEVVNMKKYCVIHCTHYLSQLTQQLTVAQGAHRRRGNCCPRNKLLELSFSDIWQKIYVSSSWHPLLLVILDPTQLSERTNQINSQ